MQGIYISLLSTILDYILSSERIDDGISTLTHHKLHKNIGVIYCPFGTLYFLFLKIQFINPTSIYLFLCVVYILNVIRRIRR